VRIARRVRGAVLALRYWSLLPAIEVALLVARLPTICRALCLSLDLESGRPPVGVWVVPRRYERRARAALRATSFWPFGDTCLRRCLLLGLVLRREKPVLRIGVKRDERGNFSAHSWLQVGDRTLDPTSDRFALLHSSTEDTA
jgi:hypothetical protein